MNGATLQRVAPFIDCQGIWCYDIEFSGDMGNCVRLEKAENSVREYITTFGCFRATEVATSGELVSRLGTLGKNLIQRFAA